MTLLFASITFDMAEVLGLLFAFFGNLGGINYSGWIAFLTAAMTFLRGLGLRLIYISDRRGVIRLSLVFIPIRMLSIGHVFAFLG